MTENGCEGRQMRGKEDGKDEKNLGEIFATKKRRRERKR